MTKEAEKDVYSAMLMILGDDLEPQDITARLGIEPNESWEKGELKLPDSKSRYEWGGWKCFIPDDCKLPELDDQINWWCDTLKGKESVMRTLEEMGCRLEMNCFATNAFQVNPDILERLAKLRLILTVFIY